MRARLGRGSPERSRLWVLSLCGFHGHADAASCSSRSVLEISTPRLSLGCQGRGRAALLSYPGGTGDFEPRLSEPRFRLPLPLLLILLALSHKVKVMETASDPTLRASMRPPLELVVWREKSIERGTKSRIIEKNGLIRAISTSQHCPLSKHFLPWSRPTRRTWSTPQDEFRGRQPFSFGGSSKLT